MRQKLEQGRIRRKGFSRDFKFDPLLTEAENLCRQFSIHGGKRFQKVFQREAVREVVEERLYGDARAFKNGRAVRIFGSRVMRESAIIIRSNLSEKFAMARRHRSKPEWHQHARRARPQPLTSNSSGLLDDLQIGREMFQPSGKSVFASEREPAVLEERIRRAALQIERLRRCACLSPA